ncbi:hypothetical protein COY95_03250, partial [Candidatus Woesearchaeota archaeon CG_4_10_14_0_8_um_filter_47_5]
MREISTNEEQGKTMKQLFGTDGIRRPVNSYPLDAPSLARLAQALVVFFREHNKELTTDRTANTGMFKKTPA